MKLSQFRFKLPDEQVAMEPYYHAFPNEDGTVDKEYSRDECRLMVVHRRSGTIEMTHNDPDGTPQTSPDGSPLWLRFHDILGYFNEHDLMIFNDTKVFPARLYGSKEKTDSKIEVFLLRELNEELRLWDVLVEPARKIRIGNKLFFDGDGPMVAEVIDNTTSRGRTLRFLYDCPHDEFKHELYALGNAPIPRYILERREATPDDMTNYQTLYARNEGAVTAPASGLHFSRELLKMLEIHGVDFAFITLHCGLGCFDNIEVEDLSKHKMSSEKMIVGKEACQKVNNALQCQRNVCAVGVSTLRATETAVGTDGLLKEYEGWTNKFVFPPYDYSIVKSLIVNFYHPETPMLMSTCAFGGYDLVMKAYQMALDNGYMFGCYGDALLILDD